MRRILCVWLKHWPAERLTRRKRPVSPPQDRAPSSLSQSAAAPQPLALTRRASGGLRLVSLNAPALAEGLQPGQTASDAKALVPALRLEPADAAAEARDLEALALWAERYTPWAAPVSFPHAGISAGIASAETGHGLVLDITGCGHLFGGEEALACDLLRRLASFGFTAACGIAATLGAAWALARHAPRRSNDADALCIQIAQPGKESEALGPLPVSALRLTPPACEALAELGLRTIAGLEAAARAPLGQRLGDEGLAASGIGAVPLRRLDQAMGREGEPVSPLHPVPVWRSRLSLAEPICDMQSIEQCLDPLTEDLGNCLIQDGYGALTIRLTLYRVDGHVAVLEAACARPAAAPDHLARIMRDNLSRLEGRFELDFGVEAMALAALIAEPLETAQAALCFEAHGDPLAEELEPSGDAFDPEVALLVDRLGNRLGLRQIRVMEAKDSHIPEQAAVTVPVIEAQARSGWRGRAAALSDWRDPGQGEPLRPISLLPCAEPVDVIAELPEGAPRLFRWRKMTITVTHACGPERVAPEWWHGAEARARTRDYYRVEDEGGRRFWLYRHGLYGRETAAPEWYVHGFFS